MATNNAVNTSLAGQTGTALFVGSTSPSLTTPRVITSINDTNGNELISVTATGSAVNEITVANAATGNSPTISATGDNTNITITLNGKGTGGVALEGTSTNDSAAAGYVGELMTSSFTATSMTSTANANLGTLNLTAGEWDIFGNCTFAANGAGVWTSSFLGYSTTSATFGAAGTYLGDNSTGFGTNSTQGYVMPPTHVRLSGNTTYYLVGQVTFTTGTIEAHGDFWARRVR